MKMSKHQKNELVSYLLEKNPDDKRELESIKSGRREATVPENNEPIANTPESVESEELRSVYMNKHNEYVLGTPRYPHPKYPKYGQ